MSNADLRDASAGGADLSDADLSGAKLGGVKRWGTNHGESDPPCAVDLRDAKLIGAKLVAADLRNADLRRADLSEAQLDGADLRFADLRTAKVDTANLRGANLIGDKLDGEHLSGDRPIKDGDVVRKKDLSHAVTSNPPLKPFSDLYNKLGVPSSANLSEIDAATAKIYGQIYSDIIREGENQ